MFLDVYENKNVYGQTLLDNYDLLDINIIDIREPFEIEICKLPHSDFIPMNTLLLKHNEVLDKNQTYYILCHTGQRSYFVTDYLTKKGFNVVNIIGGIASIDEYNVPY